MDISEPDENCSCHKVIKSEPIPQPEQEWNVHPSISSLNNPISRFRSMNIDELFSSVWTEENQASLNFNHNIEPTKGENGDTQPEILPRQGSFKTMGEIFREINTYEPQLTSINLNSTTQGATISEESLEEMTLEDFLVKARILRKSRKSSPQKIMLENFQNYGGNSSGNNIHGDQLLSNVASNYGGSNWIGDGSGTIVGNLCDNIGEGNWNNSESDVTEPSNKRRNRTNPVEVEVAVERRQRRMIKNRESAARSRARKQAYTMKLEIEQRQLKEEHRRLKLELELLKKETGKAKKTEGKLVKPMRRTLSV